MKKLVFLLLPLVVGCGPGHVLTCIEGVYYVKTSNSHRAGIVVAVGRNGKPIPCEEK